MRTPNGIAKTTTRKSVAKALSTKKTAVQIKVTEERVQELIRLKAYQLYVERGQQHGNHDQDWADAEKTVLESLG